MGLPDTAREITYAERDRYWGIYEFCEPVVAKA
jgi:hypothetical protein